uniref:Uncharacterized protein n=1 Tax=Esox lucius TaxID=8010 RepID=A0A3P8ZV98_ESOLU
MLDKYKLQLQLYLRYMPSTIVSFLCVQVRRAALQALLERERDQYVIELNRLGKAIYQQRI